MSGAFCLMLHSHIPYCKKSGVWPAGEEWLFEAMNECYIPLLKVLRRLVLEGIRPGIAVGVVPILALQLADGYMKARFLEYMGDKIVRAQHDLERFKEDEARRRVAEYWLLLFEDNVRAYVKDFHQDVLGTLRWLQDEGVVEVVTSAATHGFLPLLGYDSAVYAQVRVGVETCEQYFGKRPQGFWLPECAYRPAESSNGKSRRGIDEWLGDFGVEWFIVEDVGIKGAAVIEDLKNCGAPTTERGYLLPSGVNVFGRNGATGRQVWSSEVGYPSAVDYLEFNWQDPETGLRYNRVTGKEKKGIYNPEKAAARVKRDAAHFVRLLSAESKRAAAAGVESPVIVAPYDTELFGHWWHEGPAFLEEVLRALAKKKGVAPMRLGDYVRQNRDSFPTISMERSSWGENGDFTVWKKPCARLDLALDQRLLPPYGRGPGGNRGGGLRAGRAGGPYPQTDGARTAVDAGQRLALPALHRAGPGIRQSALPPPPPEVLEAAVGGQGPGGPKPGCGRGSGRDGGYRRGVVEDRLWVLQASLAGRPNRLNRLP